MADAYMGWDVTYAIRMIRMLEDAGIDLKWVEEPVIPGRHRWLCTDSPRGLTPISGGEHEFTRYGYRELIRQGSGGYSAAGCEPRRRHYRGA